MASSEDIQAQVSNSIPPVSIVPLLKTELESLAHISTLFQSQATECETMYQNQAEMRKMMLSDKKISDGLLAAQKKCFESTATLSKSLSGVSSLLIDLWTRQEKEIQIQAARLNEFNQVLTVN